MELTTGQKIANWQKSHGLTDAELAKKLEISISYVSRLKRDQRRLSPEKAEHGEKVMGIPFRELLKKQ